MSTSDQVKPSQSPSTFQLAETLSTISVLTGGAANLDFYKASGGTCAVGSLYADNSTCSVNVAFTPKTPGARYGGVTLQLTGSSSPIFTTAYVQGTGFGPQTSFLPGTQKNLGSVVNLSDVAADGQDIAFYSKTPIPGDQHAGGGFGSFPTVEASGSIPGSQGDYDETVAVDGAGSFCVSDQSLAAGNQTLRFVPLGAGKYALDDHVESPCPFSNQKSVIDAPEITIPFLDRSSTHVSWTQLLLQLASPTCLPPASPWIATETCSSPRTKCIKKRPSQTAPIFKLLSLSA